MNHKYGGWDNVELVNDEELNDSQIGGNVTELDWVLDKINRIFGRNMTAGDLISESATIKKKKSWWQILLNR